MIWHRVNHRMRPSPRGKAPPNVPEDNGDRVRQRGRPGRLGIMVKQDPASSWVTVTWDDGQGPTLCHRHELERVRDEG